VPAELKGDPGAALAFPGVIVAFGEPQVVAGAPGCPGPFGLGAALAMAVAATQSAHATCVEATSCLIMEVPF
jgi:hypothetical protein